MSVDQGLLSPPSSGRGCKKDQPRIDGVRTIDLHAIFAPADRLDHYQHHQRQHPHTQQHVKLSPIKQHPSILPTVRPPTPPLSCDARCDDEPTSLSAAPRSSFSEDDIEENVVRHSKGIAMRPISYVTMSSREAQSDEEVNLLLEPTSGSSSSSGPRLLSPHAHHVDSDQETWSADQDDTLASDDDEELTPRTQSSPVGFRPLMWDAPIRDTPKNPFLAGGPADQGFHGPRGLEARQRARQLPQKERGKITYVFRGQRVTYADPEYDSDDSEEWAGEGHQDTRPPRLQPRLLFPPAPLSAAMPTTQATGGGLFASQLAQKRKLAETQHQSRTSAPIAASARLQQVTAMPQHPDQAARRALLARLDQTDWSDEEEHDNGDIHLNRQCQEVGDQSCDDEEQVESVRPVKRLRQSLVCGGSHSQDEREIAFWLQDASQQRDIVAKTNLVQRMKGR